MTRISLHGLRLGCAVIALVAAALAVGPATMGFTQNHVGPGSSGPVLKWDPATMPAPWVIHPTPPPGINANLWIANFKKAMQVWMAPASSDFNFRVIGTTTVAGTTIDGKNILYSKNTAWDGPAGVLAITNYIFSGSTGLISDTDMEFNGADFTWGTSFADERASQIGDTAYDLLSIQIHELGHAIGFGHSLDNTGVNPGDADYDDNGTVGNLTDDQINGANQNTMDPATLLGETFQRSLAADDLAALDATYPAAGTTLVRPSGFLIEPDGLGDTPTTGSFTIQWIGEYEGASTPTVSLYYTQNITDSGVAALTGATLIAGGLISPTNGSTGSYVWTFNNLAAGDYHVIAVTTADSFTSVDISPGPVTVSSPVLTVTSPNVGGITMTPYDTFTLAWTVSGQNLGAVKIDLSLDSGATFPHTLLSSAFNTGAYSMMVPDPVKQFGAGPQTQCRIRISYLANPAVFDISDNDFTIALAADSLTLNAPNGGEFLTAGAVTPVGFNASGVRVGDNFHIQFSPDLGATWYEIETNVTIIGPNPRTYTWTVPGAFGTFNLLRIESVNNRFFKDTSDSPFTIGPNAPSAFTVVPGQLTFEVMLGGADPTPQALTVLNAQASTAINGITTSTSSPRVSTTGAPTSIPANTPMLFPISITNSFPSVGTYAETVTINGSGVSSKVIPVTINVRALGGASPLTYSPAALTFIGAPNSVAPGGQILSVNNPAGNVLTTVDVTTTDNRILISPGRFSVAGGASQPLTVLVDTSGLAAGTVKNSVATTAASQIGNGSFAISVTITGAAPPPVREKNHASPCALTGADGDPTGAGGGLAGILAALLAVGLLRLRVRD